MSTPKKGRLQAANAARKRKARERQLEVQKGLTKLKRAGLFSGDPKKAAKVSRGSRLVERYQDVLTGKARAVKVDTKTLKAAKDAGGKVRNGRVVVEADKKERVVFNKKSGFIEGWSRRYGATIVRRIYFQSVFDPSKLPQDTSRTKYFYQVRFPNGTSPRFNTFDLLKGYMASYKNAESKSVRVREKFNDYWASHIVVLQVVGNVSRVDWDDIDAKLDEDLEG